jgi:hypothetical protein
MTAGDLIPSEVAEQNLLGSGVVGSLLLVIFIVSDQLKMTLQVSESTHSAVTRFCSNLGGGAVLPCRSTDRVSRRGATVKNLFHSTSFRP